MDLADLISIRGLAAPGRAAPFLDIEAAGLTAGTPALPDPHDHGRHAKNESSPTRGAPRRCHDRGGQAQALRGYPQASLRHWCAGRRELADEVTLAGHELDAVAKDLCPISPLVVRTFDGFAVELGKGHERHRPSPVDV